MVTTDQTTCLRGYSSWPNVAWHAERHGGPWLEAGIFDYHERLFPFNNPQGDNTDNPNCNYTSTFNGTSSAAPNTSGVVNLILSANPNLNWREVRVILAKTATLVSPDDPPVRLELPDGEFLAHYGWQQNGAGYWYNQRFGFGRPDAGAAVRMARAGTVRLPPLIESDWQNHPMETPLLVPDASAEGVSVPIVVEDNLTLEGIQFAFLITNPDMRAAYRAWLSGSTAASDLAIEVTSPVGTVAVLATSRSALGVLNQSVINPLNDHDGVDDPEILFGLDNPILANAFLGENAAGTWTVRFLDTNGRNHGRFRNNATPSRVHHLAVRLYGHYGE